MRITFNGVFADAVAPFMEILGDPDKIRGNGAETRLVQAGDKDASGARPALELIGSDFVNGPAPNVTSFAFGTVETALTDPLTDVGFRVSEIFKNWGGVFSYTGSQVNIDTAKFASVLINTNLDVVGSGKRDVFEATDLLMLEGNDTIRLRGGNDVVYSGEGADTVRGGTGRDKIFGEGNNDILYGEKGHDRIEGGLGDDLLYGNGGRDKLFAGSGNDQLFGGGGRDILDGGVGNDAVTGGGGADIFVFQQTADGVDRILDFTDGLDKIGITAGQNVSDFSVRQEGGDIVVTYNPTFTDMRIINAPGAVVDADDFVVI